jgi:hypothetical protein
MATRPATRRAVSLKKKPRFSEGDEMAIGLECFELF